MLDYWTEFLLKAQANNRPVRLNQTEYQEYLRSEHWQTIRKRKLRDSGYACEECNNKCDLEVHHIRYKNLYDIDLADLKTLCRFCHRKAHGLNAKSKPKLKTKSNKKKKKKRKHKNATKQQMHGFTKDGIFHGSQAEPEKRTQVKKMRKKSSNPWDNEYKIIHY